MDRLNDFNYGLLKRMVCAAVHRDIDVMEAARETYKVLSLRLYNKPLTKLDIDFDACATSAVKALEGMECLRLVFLEDARERFDGIEMIYRKSRAA